jgi:hypothetical protein
MPSPIHAALLFSPRAGQVLFLVQRAADGWIALDLAGRTTDAVEARLVVTCGGPAHADRIFLLHDRLAEVAAGRALPVVGGARARYAFGGDLEELLADARETPQPRVRLFRGLSIVRDERALAGRRSVLATPELVFATPPAMLGDAFERAARPASARAFGATSPARASEPGGARSVRARGVSSAVPRA